MTPRIDHIQITVKSLKKAEEFYDQLLPLLGFDLENKSKGKVEAHDFEVIEYFHKDFILGFNSPRKAFESEEVHRRNHRVRERTWLRSDQIWTSPIPA